MSFFKYFCNSLDLIYYIFSCFRDFQNLKSRKILKIIFTYANFVIITIFDHTVTINLYFFEPKNCPKKFTIFNFTKNVKFLNFPKLNIAKYTVLKVLKFDNVIITFFENLSIVIFMKIFVNFVFLAKIVQNVQKWPKMTKNAKMHFSCKTQMCTKVTILYIFDTFQKKPSKYMIS